MGRQTDEEELRTAWRALAGGNTNDEGWRTIPIAAGLPVKVRAGRHFPGDQEALLFGFKPDQLPAATRLPEGRGFSVSLVDLNDVDSIVAWIGLARLAPGSEDMFYAMASDVLIAMAMLGDVSEGRLLQTFLARITAWQQFMERGGVSVLSLEAEIGLLGEILTLQDLLRSGVATAVAIDCWRGPLGGLRDFELGNGAIEVKTSLSSSGFPALIRSLDQLFSGPAHPLVIAATRLAVDPLGLTLPELVLNVAERLLADPLSLQRFRTLILRAGFLDAHSRSYDRRYVCVTSRLLPVTESFPRLIRTSVPREIIDARYEIDLDRVTTPPIDMLAVLKQFGVL